MQDKRMIPMLVFPTKFHLQVFRLGHIAMLQLVQGELETAVADHFLKKCRTITSIQNCIHHLAIIFLGEYHVKSQRLYLPIAFKLSVSAHI